MIVGAASSLARRRPARARADEPAEIPHQRGERLVGGVHDRRRDQPPAAQCDRDADVHGRALRVAAVAEEAAEALHLAAGARHGLEQQRGEQHRSVDRHRRVVRREPLGRGRDVHGARQVVVRDLALRARHRRSDRLRMPPRPAARARPAGRAARRRRARSTSSRVTAPSGPVPCNCASRRRARGPAAGRRRDPGADAGLPLPTQRGSRRPASSPVSMSAEHRADRHLRPRRDDDLPHHAVDGRSRRRSRPCRSRRPRPRRRASRRAGRDAPLDQRAASMSAPSAGRRTHGHRRTSSARRRRCAGPGSAASSRCFGYGIGTSSVHTRATGASRS